jgi:hypothetical protein
MMDLGVHANAIDVDWKMVGPTTLLVFQYG